MNHTHFSPMRPGAADDARVSSEVTTEGQDVRYKAWGVRTDSGRSWWWMVSLALGAALLGVTLGAWVMSPAHGGAPASSTALTTPSPTSPAHAPERASATSSGSEALAAEAAAVPNG